MYSRSETTAIKKAFWTAFGQYMKPVPGSESDSVNWVNYKTGIKDLYFRMDAGKAVATISIEMRNPGQAERQARYHQWLALRSLFEEFMQEKWDWQSEARDEQERAVARISVNLDGVSVFKRDDWPSIISFFKTRIVRFDRFWTSVKTSFEP